MSKLKDFFNSIKSKFGRDQQISDDEQDNPNKDTKKTVILVVVILLLSLCFYGLYSFMFPSVEKQVQKQAKHDNWLKVRDNEFSEDNNTSALTAQQGKIDDIQKTLFQQTKKIEQLNKDLADAKVKNEDYQQKQADLTTQLHHLLSDGKENNNDKSSRGENVNDASPSSPHGTKLDGTENQGALGDGQVMQSPMSVAPMVQNFSNPYLLAEAQHKARKQNQYKRTWKNYVPTGTFCRAVLMGAADANAGVDGQGNASPILFKIMNNCVLPNGKYSKIKNAFITASVYGRISSERGEVRLENISYIRKDGSILDMPVEGTAFDVSGKNGIRGIPVMRNGKIIQMSGLSGFLSGVGSAVSQSSQTVSTSALGSTTTLNGGDVFKAGLGKGAETALSKIADYYIKLAEQYSPIIQLRAGAMVDIVFLKGFPIEDEKMIARYEKATNDARLQAQQSKNMQTIQIPTNPLMNKLPTPISQGGNTSSQSMTNSQMPQYQTSLDYNRQFNETAQDRLDQSAI